MKQLNPTDPFDKLLVLCQTYVFFAKEHDAGFDIVYNSDWLGPKARAMKDQVSKELPVLRRRMVETRNQILDELRFHGKFD